MKTRQRIGSIASFRLIVVLTALGPLGVLMGMLILLRWEPSKAESQESLTIRERLMEENILLGWKPGVEELAELGCLVTVEPTYVH